MNAGTQHQTDGEVVRRTLRIANERGLHARAAAKFVSVAGTYDADISVCKDGTEVSGLSIMGLMMLAAGKGCRIELVARGREARAAIDALARLVADKFEDR
jgi:phosphocarrier protein